MGFFAELSILNRLLFVAGLVAAISGVYGIWHHTIYKSGEDACQARYTEAAAAQATKAQTEIKATGEKYVQIESDINKESGFSVHSSPLVASAISRMPSPHSRAH